MKTQNIQALADSLWDSYCEIFPKLVKFDCPKIVVNNRLTSTAGRAFTELNQIDLGGKFLRVYPERMMWDTLPHEIAHQIDYNLNGWYTRKPHHGAEWLAIVRILGIKTNPFHSYDVSLVKAVKL
jgi:predicted SprT family Zn-dependent metalloprotease